MRWNDLRPGTKVYHTLFTHWGKGVVERIDGVGYLEGMFEGGDKRAVVRFEGCDGTVRIRANELRKTPNRKKIRSMVELYRKRGVDAVDGGDRLVMPETYGK